MQVEAPAPEPLCRPRTVSHFEIEQSLSVNGIHADIRRFGWDHSCKGQFRADYYYLDYSLAPGARGSRLLQTDRRHTPLPGEMVFLPEGSMFDAECAPSEQRLLCLTFDNEGIARLFEDDTLMLKPAPCFDVRAQKVRQLMTRIADEVREPGFASDVLVESTSIMLVIELCRHLKMRQRSDASSTGKIANWRLQRIRDRISAGIDGQLSITDLAADCGMSARHLVRTFKNTVGVTLNDYIAATRIRQAQRALAQEDALIKNVAADCGFQSAAAFSAAFRRATGSTPKEYRQRHFRYRF